MRWPTTLVGNIGANVLDGGLGNDTLSGGGGNDTYRVDSTLDVITDNASEGTDTVQSAVAWTLGTNTENLTLIGSSAIPWDEGMRWPINSWATRQQTLSRAMRATTV